MFTSKREWMEWISYGLVGLFSLSMFVFGVMFPEYTFVEESYTVMESDGRIVSRDSLERAAVEKEVERLQELLRDRNSNLSHETETHKEGELKITCLSYEYLKEIMNGWD